MNTTTIRTYLAITLSMFFWSFSFIWTHQALKIYPPNSIVLFRLILAGGLLFVFSKAIGKLQKIQKKDIRYFMLLSFFEPFLYFIGESQGLQLISSTVASVIIATIPIFISIIGYFFLREKVNILNIIGVFISFAGVFIIIFTKNLSLSANPLGIAFLFLAVFSAIFYTLILKKLIEKYNAFTIVTWQNIIASFGFIPLFFIYDFSIFSEIGFSFKGFTYILLLAIFASNMAFILYTYSIKHIGITKASVFSNLIPIITAFFAFIILNEQLTIIKYLGIFIVIIGLFISQININKKKKNE